MPLHIPPILPAHFVQRMRNLSQGAVLSRLHQCLKEIEEDAVKAHPLFEDVFSLILDGAFHFTDNLALEIRWSSSLHSPCDEAAVDANEATLIPWIGWAVTVRGAYRF